MLELCFDRSARGGLRAAQHCGDPGGMVPIARSSAVHIRREELPEEDRQQAEALRKRAEERFRYVTEARKNAVSLGGDPEDVLGLELALSVGDIREPLAEACSRRELLRRWFEDGELADRYWRESMEAVRRLEACGDGERVRVWVDQTPDSLCGLLFAAGLLVKAGAQASAVFLPPWRDRLDRTVVMYKDWGELAPEEFGSFLPLEQPLTPGVLRMLAARWQTLRGENAPLRAVVNGRVRSVGEDFYDDLIRKALPEGRRKIALVIGDILGREQPGIGDSLLADRIRVLLEQGEYRLVQEVPEAFYKSVIEKV